MKYAIVLAAGQGTRMKSETPKVMHSLVDKPMLEHIIENLEEIAVDETHVVVGYQKEQIKEYFQNRVQFHDQEELLGTGHAVMQVQDLQDKEGKTILLYGDCPLVQPETMESLFKEVESVDMVVLTADLKDPGEYGRVVRDNQGKVIRIVEYRDASDHEKKIREINTGIYCFNNKSLFKYLNELSTDNSQNEYYITDLVEIFAKQNLEIKAIKVNDINEVMGINSRVQLAQAEKWLRQHINCYWMEQGVTLIDPNNTYISTDTTIGQDTIIYPGTYLKGKNQIGQRVEIRGNTWLENVEIGDNTIIEASKIIDSRVSHDVKVGPFAHLRNGTIIEAYNRIGNFVEVKKSTFHEDARCAHLSYIGDTTVGKKVNIGAGVVTVNFDGFNKHHTEIEEGAFIGSNVNLIAPITVGKEAVVAAGSTIKKDVADGALVIERAMETTKEGYGWKYLAKKHEKE